MQEVDQAAIQEPQAYCGYARQFHQEAYQVVPTFFMRYYGDNSQKLWA